LLILGVFTEYVDFTVFKQILVNYGTVWNY